MRINVSDERRGELLQAVKTHFRDHHDDDLGDLRASLILDFFIEKLGPSVYNQALGDAQAFLQDKLLDLEGELYLEEEER